jgi:hypothetical protein
MEELTKKIAELYDSLVVKDRELKSQKEDLRQKSEKLAQDLKANAEWEADLKARAEKIKAVEDVLAVTEENKKVAANNAAERKRLNQDRAAFEEEKKAQDKKIKDAQDDVRFKNEKLTKAQEALAEKEKSYKAEVLEAVHKEQLANAKKVSK